MDKMKTGRAALFLSFMVLTAGTLTACSDGKGNREESALESVFAEEQGTQEKPKTGPITELQTDPEQEGKVWEKEETVYVKADASGNVSEITVETILKNPGDSAAVWDESTLQDIRNTKGEEEFTRMGDGTLLWDNCGQDIYYKGSSNEELPVSVKITYYLDGEEITPQKLAGKSGKVRIRFDYTNHTLETVESDGNKMQVHVPFAVMSVMMLPSDVFSDIEVSEGKVITMDDQNMVAGIAYPGLAEDLNLASYEVTEEMEIPDHLEVTAQVKEFQLAFTATVITTGTFADMDMEDLQEIDDLVSDMKELTEASKELVDGTGELYDAAEKFAGYLEEYKDGAEAMESGADGLADGLEELNDQKEKLAEGASALQTGLETLDKELSKISLPQSGQTVSDGNPSPGAQQDLTTALAGNMTALVRDISLLKEQLKTLQDVQASLDPDSEEAKRIGAVAEGIQTQITDMEAQLSSMQAGFAEFSQMAAQIAGLGSSLGTFKSGISQLAEGSRQLSEGITAFNQGIGLLHDGSVKLSDGAEEFAEAGEELRDGFEEMKEGMEELRDGVAEFDEEGIQSIGDLAGEELARLVDRIRAVKTADERYDNFAGIREGQNGSVKFIIETEEIE